MDDLGDRARSHRRGARRPPRHAVGPGGPQAAAGTPARVSDRPDQRAGDRRRAGHRRAARCGGCPRGAVSARNAIATSCTLPLAKARIAAADLVPPSVLVTADQVEHGKPAPDPFLLAAERLGVAPERCLVVEDAPAGLTAAEAAGCYRLAVITTTPEEELVADGIVRNLGDVEFVASDDGTIKVRMATSMICRRSDDPAGGPRSSVHHASSRGDPHRPGSSSPRPLGGHVRGARAAPVRVGHARGPAAPDSDRARTRVGARRHLDDAGPSSGWARHGSGQRPPRGSRHAAYAAGQAGAVAHVAAHELGAAAYAIKAARAAVPATESDAAGRRECRWQREQLPDGDS